MRKNLLALGILVLLIGLVSLASSRVAVKQGWMTAGTVQAQPSPTEKLSVQGYLKKGDKFRVNFVMYASGQEFFLEPEVWLNVTDPNGHIKLYQIPVTFTDKGLLATTKPFPEDTANCTGTYNVSAEAFEILLRSLTIFREKEPLYPYGFLFPVGAAISLSGVGISLLAVKISKPKRIRYKRRLHEYAKRFVDTVATLESMFPIESL